MDISPTQDNLSHWLDEIEIRNVSMSMCALRAPWGVAFDTRMPCTLNAISHGRAVARFESGEVLELEVGDVLMTLGGLAYTISSSDGVECEGVRDVFARFGLNRWRQGALPRAPHNVEYGGDGPLTRIRGMAFEFNGPHKAAILSRLPPIVHLRRDENVIATWLGSVLSGIARESERDVFGYAAVATRLAELVVFSTIRSYLRLREDEHLGSFVHMADCRVARVLTVLDQDPCRPWTIAELADVARMSRSAFCARFARMVGESPIEYLTRLRMRLAARRLNGGSESVKTLACSLGYASGSAFSVAFKRHFRISPKQYRSQLEQA